MVGTEKRNSEPKTVSSQVAVGGLELVETETQVRRLPVTAGFS